MQREGCKSDQRGMRKPSPGCSQTYHCPSWVHVEATCHLRRRMAVSAIDKVMEPYRRTPCRPLPYLRRFAYSWPEVDPGRAVPGGDKRGAVGSL